MNFNQFKMVDDVEREKKLVLEWAKNMRLLNKVANTNSQHPHLAKGQCKGYKEKVNTTSLGLKCQYNRVTLQFAKGRSAVAQSTSRIQRNALDKHDHVYNTFTAHGLKGAQYYWRLNPTCLSILVPNMVKTRDEHSSSPVRS